ncbi:3221_t:CDS:2, partial [Racocetra persica]
GFACASVRSCEVITNQSWPGVNAQYKTNTVLQYDEDFNVIEWGARALVGETRQRRNRVRKLPRPVELFKLHLGKVPENEKPELPRGLSPERAIADYLGKMAEAAAIHCMKVLKDHGLKTGATYLVVDCGGGTVDLTVRKLLSNNQLSETTERSGDFCGGTYVDRNFIEYLKRSVGEYAISSLKEKHYGQFYYVIQQFCERVKIPFTGNPADFRTFEFDLLKYCDSLIQYLNSETKNELEDEDWVIDINYETVKSFFDPVVDQIIDLIDDQLKKIHQCSIIFLVGGFIAAITRGAVEYGLDTDAIKTRVLKWTYGIEVSKEFKEGDPPSRKTSK